MELLRDKMFTGLKKLFAYCNFSLLPGHVYDCLRRLYYSVHTTPRTIPTTKFGRLMFFCRYSGSSV